jgi:hypothetical protein
MPATAKACVARNGAFAVDAVVAVFAMPKFLLVSLSDERPLNGCGWCSAEDPAGVHSPEQMEH